MSDYGPECSGGIVGAVGQSVFRVAIPIIGSLLSPAQLEQGDQFHSKTEKLLDEYFETFHDHTKIEIKNQLRR